MADSDFPSGPWTGYYQYPDGERGHQDLRLVFDHGRMTGTGADVMGGFSIEGTYDADSKEAQWVKRFPGGHMVHYRGFREGPLSGIWGTWHIPRNWSGGFHIWPLGETATEDVENVTWQPVTETVPREQVTTARLR